MAAKKKGAGDWYCLHFGAGALGLGLIVWALDKAGMPTSVLNRANSAGADRIRRLAQDRSFSLYTSGKRRPDRVSFQSCVEISADHEPLRQLAQHNGPLLLTTALKREGVEQSVGAMASVLRARPPGALTVVIACENQIDSWYLRDVLAREGRDLTNETVFVRCVVDRICNKPDLEASGVVVAVEPFAKWYLDGEIDADARTALNAALSRLVSSGEVEWAEDFDFVVKRKKWVVNSSHLLISMAAHWFGEPAVDRFVQSDPFAKQMLVGVVGEMSKMLAHIEGDRFTSHRERQLERFAASLCLRIEKHPQRVSDTITRFKSRETLHAFIEDMHRKVTEPYLHYVRDERFAPFFSSLVTAMVFDLVKNDRWIS